MHVMGGDVTVELNASLYEIPSIRLKLFLGLSLFIYLRTQADNDKVRVSSYSYHPKPTVDLISGFS